MANIIHFVAFCVWSTCLLYSDLDFKCKLFPETSIISVTFSVRFAEENPVHGLILVGAYISDLGDANEAASGYFSGHLSLWNYFAILI